MSRCFGNISVYVCCLISSISEMNSILIFTLQLHQQQPQLPLQQQQFVSTGTISYVVNYMAKNVHYAFCVAGKMQQRKINPPFTFTACVEATLDIAFVIDTSGSICENDPTYSNGICDNWRFMLDFVNNVISSLGIETDKTRVGVVTFSTEGEFQFGLDAYV